MEHDWTPIRTFKTKAFRVRLEYTYDDSPDLSWADTETLENLNTGKWGCYLFRVQVTFRGQEVGCDYLGSSIYADPAGFATEHRQGNAYFPDMVRTAIAESRAELTRDRPYIRTAA